MRPPTRHKRGVQALEVLLLGALACSLQSPRGSETDLAATVAANDAVLQTRAAEEADATTGASVTSSFTPPAQTSAAPAPTKSAAKATRTPKPTPSPGNTLTPTIGVPYTPGVPAFPIHFTATHTCASTMSGPNRYLIDKVSLTWEDVADNETGYRLYLATKQHPNPGLGDTLGPNVDHYEFEQQYLDFALDSDPWTQYFIAAYNDVGESIRMGALLEKCR